MRDVIVAITAASHSGNKGAAAMLRSSISQLREHYGERIQINLMSVYPKEDAKQLDDCHIQIISTKPEQLVFFAFPLAILYWLLRFIPQAQKLLLKNRILKAYSDSDIVIDEAGISFVDSRGFVMNTYAFICAAVPMLIGVPVVKYSQALGSFCNPYNRILARWILPKMRFIAARGQVTFDHLRGIGIKNNVKICADGAFSMPDDKMCTENVQKRCKEDPFYLSQNIIGLSISSVVHKKCDKQKSDYIGVMVNLIDWLNDNGYPVLIIANAARIYSKKARNNDLMTGDEIYARIANCDMVRWYHEEMRPEEIRELIGRCRFLIASRFHAMIAALQRKVPVLLIGWSHKYQEVLDMFELGNYAIDYSQMSLDSIITKFDEMLKDEFSIREKLETYSEEVEKSSKENIHIISGILDSVVSENRRKSRIFDLNHPERYTGTYLSAIKGYASDADIRSRSASGGMITALLCDLIDQKEIDGAWVVKAIIENGRPVCKQYIATTAKELKDAAGSVYMSFPQLANLSMLEEFQGRVAVVMIPCMLDAFNTILKKRPDLSAKVVLKIGLYCSGNHDPAATKLALQKSGLPLEGATRLYYRRGHWRGQSALLYADGSEKLFSYSKLLCAYKNAYFFEKHCCMSCKDHFASCADLSFGDVWLDEMKKNPIKYGSCIIRTVNGMERFKSAVIHERIHAEYISDISLLRSQKRALVFKFNHEGNYCHWNHKLAYFLANKNMQFSEKHFDRLKRIPSWVIYYYMCFIRLLLSF